MATASASEAERTRHGRERDRGTEDPDVTDAQPDALPCAVRRSERARHEAARGRGRGKPGSTRPTRPTARRELGRGERGEQDDRRVAQSGERRVHGVARPAAERRGGNGDRGRAGGDRRDPRATGKCATKREPERDEPRRRSGPDTAHARNGGLARRLVLVQAIRVLTEGEIIEQRPRAKPFR